MRIFETSCLQAWPELLGATRCKWSLAYKAFLGGGAVLGPRRVDSDLERGEVLM